MTGKSSRRALLALACATMALLGACSSSEIVDPFTPTRILSVGDGFSDLGQDGKRYTVNDGSINIWTQYIAALYGLPLVASDQGGLSYARGDALVSSGPNSIVGQVDKLLAANKFAAGDLVVVNGGVADIVTTAARTDITYDQKVASLNAAGLAMAAQVNRIVQAGATHILASGVWPLGQTPLGTETGQVTNLNNLTLAFNNAFKIGMVNLGANVLWLDTATYYNNVYYNPTAYPPLNNVVTKACTTVLVTDCTPATITPGFDYNTLLFANGVYPTPSGHRLLGSFAQIQVANRW
jgi:phospholipase/lecithinase/hemolysin